MTLNPAVTQVADGRRRAVRSIVMGSLASIPCQVWRKVLIPSQPATPTGTGFGWSDVATSSFITFGEQRPSTPASIRK